MHKYLLIYIGVLLPLLSVAQSTPSLNGFWEGTITQDENGNRINYKIELTLVQQGNKITGRSKVYHEEIYAVMSLEGRLNGKTFFTYRETEILDYTIRPNLEWCIKKAELILKKDGNFWLLEGLWEGTTSSGDCVPGRVYLKKGLNRA